MLEGALIGAIVGLVMAFMVMRQRRNLLAKLLAALTQGGQTAARALLDASAPPTQSLTLRDIDKQRQRMAGLAIIGDVEALAREIEMHKGPLTAVTQVNRIGYLGLALRSQGESRARTIAVGFRVVVGPVIVHEVPVVVERSTPRLEWVTEAGIASP